MKQQMDNASGKKRSQGYTLVELIVVLVIIALMIIGMLSYVSHANSSRKTQAEIKGLTSIIGSTKIYKTGGTYGTGDLIPVLIHSNQIPTAAYNIDGTKVTNQWGGALTIQGKGASFEVSDAMVPSDACADLLTGIGNSETTITAKVGSKAVPKTSSGFITATSASTACGDGDQTIVFTVNG